MKYCLTILLLSLMSVQQSSAQLVYPVTQKGLTEDTYFGTTVKDPYRWLEDDNSAETKKWVIAQNAVTGQYLNGIPFRQSIKTQLAGLWNYPKYSSPFKKNEYYYYYKNDGLQNQSVLYRQKGLNGTSEVFIDPNQFSKDGTAALGNLAFSKNGRYCAYFVAKAGSDWQTASVMDMTTKKVLTDSLHWIKFSGIAWKGDEGFYYSRYPQPTEEASKLSKKNENHRIYFHKIGQPQGQDELVYEDAAHPMRFLSAQITEDERFLVIYKSEGTSGRELLIKDLKANGDFTHLVKGFTTNPSLVDNEGDAVLVLTDDGAPNFKLVSIDPQNPAKENWKDIIPTRSKLLQWVSAAGGKLFLCYLEDASSRIYQCNRKGNLERAIQLPGIGTASGFGGIKTDQELFYTYSSFNYPPSIFRYDVKTGTSELFRKTEVKVNTDNYVTLQSFCTSKDGTKVSMFITYKKGLQLNGNNPVLMYGYGGFNLPQTPSFNISNAFFIEQGGVYVVVTLRGGNEYGEEWHKGGMLLNKQNVFDDFIAAAEFLIAKKYTQPSKLAIRGGSNGGTLVGACVNQRPDLFKVALPAVGVMDMLRYHLFTIGWGWAVEYGRSDKSEVEFKNLYAYSPLHNLKPGTNYPATLVTTADHDDRVVPAHSFKYAATLQAYNKGNNPTLIRIETNAGHGAGKPTSKLIEEAADIWSFVMHNLGMEFKPIAGL
jgi:prolyl oligopeptidase